MQAHSGPLTRLRMPVVESRGRRYPESQHPYRNDYQRDRDRIVHARAFRRLENKTQVFAPGLSDHFRNRLTHTIEVAQIARTVAGALGLDEDLTEALALAHDIGHPPFAHAGEDVLNHIMQRYGEVFDHNRHALRIVEHFEQRYALFPGLNLTFEVREGMVKHSRDLDPERDADLAEYLPELRPPLEAQLIDLADEIAYNTADLDDAYSAGFFTRDELCVASLRSALIDDELETQIPAATEPLRMHELIRRLLNHLVSGLIEGTRAAAEGAGVRTMEDVRRHPARLARIAEPAAMDNTALKQFLHGRVYHSERLAPDRQRAAQQIAALFDHFLEHPDDLPEAYRERTAGEAPHRVVCDYLAGMTDGFFDRTYRQLVGVETG